jgi:hypothetical protein
VTDHEAPATLPNGLPAPPVPNGLRERLRDYPKHIQKIQSELIEVVVKPLKGTPLFEQAIWALEGCLEEFIQQARDELAAAIESGDAAMIEHATQKKRLMLHSRSAGSWKMKELMAYFDAGKHEVSHGQ